MAMKRSGRFYRRNEEDVMRMLGLNPTKNSGSGWIEKEDGQNEHLICQLKSTDANSIKVNKQDIDVLEYNASVTHKLPVFAIQFLQAQRTFLIVAPENIGEVAKYLETGKFESREDELGLDLGEDVKPKKKKTIKSSLSARQAYQFEREQKYKKKNKSAL